MPFTSHIRVAHAYWKNLIEGGGCVIDATCGNGHDTLFLAQLVLSHDPKGLVLGMDIQEQALAHTRSLLESNLSPTQRERIHLYLQSHETFPPLAYSLTVSLIVYNLGYLPGGNKQLTTQTSSTLVSLQAALSLLSPRGSLSITCYPGHEKGLEEEKAIIAWSQELPSSGYAICHHRWINRRLAPSLLLIKKIIS